jgi:ABC-type lipoprotein release transport system permease subunit
VSAGGTGLSRIAWRNLWRNRRRTGLALAAIGLSVALVLVYDSVLRWESDWLFETVTGPMLGHVQVHAPDWRRTRAMDRTVRNVPSVMERLRRDPDVATATPRIYAPALAALGEEGFGVIVLGVDLAAEARPSRLLAGASARPAPGHILVGRLLAEQMGVRPGAQVALVGQGIDGSLANDLFTVDALVTTPVDLVNRQGVVMSLEDAQLLFVMPGEAHEIVLYAHDAARAGALAARLNGTAAIGGAEALDWRTLAPAIVDLIALVDVVWIFVLVLVLIAAAAGVANTMLMATFERTHELGMLLALGMTPSRVVTMILLESLALGIIGALIGTAVGSTLVAWAHHTGVDYAALTGGGPSQLSFFGMNWSLRMYPRLTLVDITRAVTAVMVTSLVASAWPAVRAARLQPARALKA